MIQQFHPVMRHFFTEKHKDPMAWFAMRLNYTRSVAVASMVGWVLGIGDRHCSNILIDTITGELVHIDFGIVFEEVRIQTCPPLKG
jgi:ataxia telangiectasia mutated family protein